MSETRYSSYLKTWDNSADWYYSKIKKIPVLSADELRALIYDAQKGDMEARDTVIVHNLRLVMKIACKYSHPRLTRVELCQEGTLGLFAAINTYDYAKGAFTTHAVYWIRQKIERYIREYGSIVRIPEYVWTFRNQFNRLTDEYIAEIGRPPTRQEIARALELTPDMVRSLDLDVMNFVSLEAHVDSESEVTLKDLIGATEPTADQDTLDIVIGMLPSRLRAVLLWRAKGMRLREIALRLRITRERVRQLERDAIQQVKNRLAQARLGIIKVKGGQGAD